MTRLADYEKKYRHIRLERRNGILQMTLHSDGGALVWGGGPHEELSYAFADVGRDPENKLIILTGTGDSFCAGLDEASLGKITAAAWDHLYSDAKRLVMNQLEIEVPMIAAVNGPAFVHAELAVLCDIVLASENAAFQDAPHVPSGLVPGDGVHVVWPLVLGPNRGRYFLLTGQKLSAHECCGTRAVVRAPAHTYLPRKRLHDI